MINTYQTSAAPPPLPPRHADYRTVLVPATPPSPGHSKYLIRFLVAVVILHLLLSVAGFIFLYHFEQMGTKSSSEPKADSQKSVKQMFYKAWARMVVDRSTDRTTTSGYLQWDMIHSVRRTVNYFDKSWVTVKQAGDYHVSSRVTFSKDDSPGPLFSRIVLVKEGTKAEEVLMQAYCSLGGRVGEVCTATQGGVFTLNGGDRLGVWTENLSKVDYDDKATSFGIHQL